MAEDLGREGAGDGSDGMSNGDAFAIAAGILLGSFVADLCREIWKRLRGRRVPPRGFILLPAFGETGRHIIAADEIARVSFIQGRPDLCEVELRNGDCYTAGAPQERIEAAVAGALAAGVER